jgi:hypothetical protein
MNQKKRETKNFLDNLVVPDDSASNVSPRP